jgi:hypothetical protein
MDRWPNLFIVGAPKAGTTSLYAYLCNVPGIYMSPIKEPNYFSISLIPDGNCIAKPIRDTSQYLRLFHRAKDAQLLGEASPTYLADPEAPKLIHQMSPQAHIIISLRDPVERAFSHYLMMVSQGHTVLSFQEELQKSLRPDAYYGKWYLPLDFGLYHESIQRYLNLFGARNVTILIFEELISNAKAQLGTVLNSLGIHYTFKNFQGETHNPFITPRGRMAQYISGNTTIRRFADMTVSRKYRRIFREKLLVKQVSKPKIQQEVKEFLVSFYANDVQHLQQALGRKLPWPNFQHVGQ